MTFGQFLSILRARWWLALTVLLLTVVATTLGVSLMLPKQYTATAASCSTSSPTRRRDAVRRHGAPALMATQVDIIESDRVAQRVVRNLKLTENPQIRAAVARGRPRARAASRPGWPTCFQAQPGRQAVARDRASSASATRRADPRFAAALANAFVQAYIDTALDLRVDPARQYSTFFDTRVEGARDALEKAQTKLSALPEGEGHHRHRRAPGHRDRAAERAVVAAVALQAIVGRFGSRQAQAARRAGDQMQEVLNNPARRRR